MTETASQRGKRAYLSGQSAEKTVLAIYESNGLKLAAERWRGAGAEIDLIFRDGATCVFVEVKKSRDFAAAAQRLSPAQTIRIMKAATSFVANEPSGQLTDMRFDVALVNAIGETQIVENALIAD